MTFRPCSSPKTARGFAGGLLVLLLLSACAPVQPWERGRLAQPRMALDEDPMLAAISAHIYDSKEASSGGSGPAGGGCGCN